MIGLLVALASAAPAPEPSTETPLGQIPQAVLDAAEAARHLPLGERMKAVSTPLLGLPYVSDPLGEGAGFDQDPFARYDAYDCLTFVEEVLSLSMSGDPVHAAHVRNQLRYGDNNRDYAHRRHFMELQWIPGNIDAGWLVDTTAEYGEATVFRREVDETTWKSWRQRARFALGDEDLPTGTMELTVLSLAEATASADQVRPGTVVLTVRADRPWSPIWISHVGFVVHAEGEVRVRHATKMGSGRSRDHSLTWYLEHLTTYTNWPAVGVSYLEPVEQGPRRLIEATKPAPAG
jgi:hypothetical protein